MRSKKIFAILLSIFFVFSLANFSLANYPEYASENEGGSNINLNAGGGSELEVDRINGGQLSAFMGKSGLSGTVRAENIVAVIIKTILSILGVIFVILMIFSGFQWMTAGGNEDQVKKSQSRIKNAVIGLVIVILAYSITAFIFKNLPSGGSSTEQTDPPAV